MTLGIYTILLKGKGNFTGEREVTFTITENTLMSKVTVAKVKNQQYTGEEIIPELTVKNGKILLEEGIDYTVTFENNVEIGTATAILTGVGDYSGEKKVTFKISGRSISKAKITGVPKSVVYTGEAITIDSEVWGEEPVLTMTINKEKRTLEEGIDYTISYLKNTNKGIATIVFTGINGYSGTLKKTFKITAYDMKKNVFGLLEAVVDEAAVYAKGGSKPKPITTPILAIVLPKPFVTVLTQPVRVDTIASPEPKGIARTAMMIAEMMSEGNACILVKMIRSIIITMPIAIARTG